MVSSGTTTTGSYQISNITTSTLMIDDQPHHTVDSWLDEAFLSWRPRGEQLGQAKDMRRAKTWFHNHQVSMEPDVCLVIPPEHRMLVSRRKQSLKAAQRIQAHFRSLVDLLRTLRPETYHKELLAVQISNAIHKQQSAGVVAALQELLTWDEEFDWRVRCWWQRPTSHSSKLIIWFRMIGIHELAEDANPDGIMKARHTWQMRKHGRR